MEIEHCEFPDSLLYNLEDNTWVHEDRGIVTVGITSLLSSIAGKLTAARIRPVGTNVKRGNSLGTLEGVKFVGPVPSPVTGTITEVNRNLAHHPRLINDSPYTDGWIARVRPSSLLVEKTSLSRSIDATETFRKRIAETRVRCFKVFPDHEIVEIGTECSAVLVHLDELLETIPLGEAVHLVTDDPTSYVEMVRWSDQTHQELIEWRRETDLFHFIVRKSH